MFSSSYMQLKPVSSPPRVSETSQTIIHGKCKGLMREKRVIRNGVAVAAKAKGLQKGTGWEKEDYTSVRADEMAGKLNRLSGRRLFGSLS